MQKNLLHISEPWRNSISYKFHLKTKIKNFNKLSITPYETWSESWKNVYYKAYPRFPQILLPDPANIQVDLIKTLINRESKRDYASKPLTSQQLSDVLYYSCGLKRYLQKGKSEKRFYSSAGGRYPLEVYPIVFNVKQLQTGIYHYHLKTHSLELIYGADIQNDVMRQFSQEWLSKAAVLIIITAVFDRTETKYQSRGYRHILTEYGHVAQNIYLMSTALKLGCCSIGGFIESGLQSILDVDPIDEDIIGVISVGNV